METETKVVKISSYYGGDVFYCGSNANAISACFDAILTLGITTLIEFNPKNDEK